jgi:hypothetical protein
MPTDELEICLTKRLLINATSQDYQLIAAVFDMISS